MPQDVHSMVHGLGEGLVQKAWRLATAESCTGGGIARVLTDLSGSSAWFEGGIVAYSNEMKMNLLGVPAELLAAEGAVSEAVARAMARGALAASGADLAVAVTGIAGPDGGSKEKPVGTVWFAWAGRDKTETDRQQFEGDRQAVREATIEHAIRRLGEWL
ncbi:MAG: CinA family protein [Gammaproteobacteria bacterium]|nr:CinA family protein [Gammaproteobacteria bacterium]